MGILALVQHIVVNMTVDGEFIAFLIQYYNWRRPKSIMLHLNPNGWVRHLNDPLLQDNDAYFRQRFRMSVPCFNALFDELSFYHIAPSMGRGHPPVIFTKMLMITLFRLGHNVPIRMVSELFSVSASSAVKVTRYVLDLIFTNLLSKYVQWPTNEQRIKLVKHNLTAGQNANYFTGVVGYVDGSHIPVSPAQIPLANRKDYYCRKGFYSVLMQAVVDWKLRFRDLCIGPAGSQHDSRVLNISGIPSRIHVLLSARQYLLGDSGYPLYLWLITPFRDDNNLTPRQKMYNRTLSSMRVNVEMAFGHLKSRFPSLATGLNTNLANINIWIAVCAILHNFCIECKDTHWATVDLSADDDQNAPADGAPAANATQLRNSILAKFINV